MSAPPPKADISQTGFCADLRLRLQLDDDPKPMGVPRQLYDLKERAQAGQPPRRRLLDQVSIPTIGENLFHRPGCDGKEAVPHRDCSKITTMPFKPNALFAFVKTETSFHGVEPVTDPDTKRWLLLYDIYVRQAAQQPLNAPQTSGNVTFKM